MTKEDAEKIIKANDEHNQRLFDMVGGDSLEKELENFYNEKCEHNNKFGECEDCDKLYNEAWNIVFMGKKK